MFGIYTQVVCIIVRAFLEKKNDELPNWREKIVGGRWFRWWVV